MNKIRNIIDVIKAENDWYLDFMDRLKLIKEDYITFHLRNGLKFKTRSGTFDRNAIREIFIHKVYNPQGFELQKGDVVMDVGAHIGTFSLFASQKASVVYAYEPTLESYALLEHNRLINQAWNIMIERKALSDEIQVRKMFMTKENTGGHSFYQDTDDYEEVQTTTMSEIFEKNCIRKLDFLKMDCEGAEFSLFTTPKEILGRIGRIAMECHGVSEDKTIQKMSEFLTGNGFKVEFTPNPIFRNSGMLYAKR